MSDATNASTPSNSDKVKFAADELRTIKSLLHYKLQTIQADVNLPSLIGKSGYYLTVGMDENSIQLLQSPAGAGSAGDIASQLANSTDPLKGAGLINYNSALAYAAGSVGYKLKGIDAAIAAAVATVKQIPTGFLGFGIYSAATIPTGWLPLQGGTIGNAASGATVRANADTQALFTLLWTVTAAGTYIIQDSTGAASVRGASAAADFAANKRFPLPNVAENDALVAAVASASGGMTVGQVISHHHSLGASSGPGATNQISSTTSQAPGTINTTDTGGSKNLASGMLATLIIAL